MSEPHMKHSRRARAALVAGALASAAVTGACQPAGTAAANPSRRRRS